MKKFNKYLSYKNNRLFLENTEIHTLVSKYKTPFYIYSENELLDNFKAYVDASNKHHINSIICFALKSNNNFNVLKSLAQNGSGADIVSSGELLRAIEAGIPSKKIVFSGVAKSREDILLGIEKNILSFNVESIDELELINSVAKEMNKVVDIAFRFNPKVHAITHKHISTGYKTHKFGLLKEDILQAIDNNELWTNCKLIGLSVHIGSQLTSMQATQEAVYEICNLANLIPFPLDFIDVGGGLGVDYDPKNMIAPSTESYIEMISNIVKTKMNYSLKILFEPGRSISASCGFLISKVIRNKRSEDCNFLIVDGGMNDFVRPALYDAYHEIYSSSLNENMIKTDIVGPVCETADCFGQSRMLSEMKPGDFIALSHAGAYGFTMSSTYNMRDKPLEIFLKTDGDILST